MSDGANVICGLKMISSYQGKALRKGDLVYESQCKCFAAKHA